MDSRHTLVLVGGGDSLPVAPLHPSEMAGTAADPTENQRRAQLLLFRSATADPDPALAPGQLTQLWTELDGLRSVSEMIEAAGWEGGGVAVGLFSLPSSSAAARDQANPVQAKVGLVLGERQVVIALPPEWEERIRIAGQAGV
jgi:hypothetical protein